MQIETLIWLTEAPPAQRVGIDIPSDGGDFVRLCCKMATGSGKTIVMAMAIAWHVLNKVAYPQDARFSKNVLVIAPGLTVAQSTMGLIKAQRGDVPRAAEYLMQARKSPKPPSDPGNLLIRCLAALGQSAEISALQPPATIAERHGEAVLLALFAWQTNQSE